MSSFDLTLDPAITHSSVLTPSPLTNNTSTSIQFDSSHSLSNNSIIIKKRAHTTLSDKVMIINFIKQNPSLDQAAIAKHFQKNGFPTLSQSTISRYIKDQNKYLSLSLDSNKSKLKKQNKFQSIKNSPILNCLEFWYYQLISTSSKKKPLNNLNQLIESKSKTFQNLIFKLYKQKIDLSNDVLENFLENQPKRLKYPFSTDFDKPKTLETELLRLRKITDLYLISDILAMDEIALAYACPPTKQNKSLNQPKLTLVLTCSADGNWKDIPLIIGNQIKSKVYPLENVTSNGSVGFHYYSNKKSVMTYQIWEKYLLNLNENCQKRNRKVLLLVDTINTHLLPDPSFSNIRIEYIHTSNLNEFDFNDSPPSQPFIAGITRYFKSEYRIRFCLRALSSDEFGLSDLYQIDQSAATRIIQDSWNCVKPDTIKNVFKHTGLLSSFHFNEINKNSNLVSCDHELIIVPDKSIEQSIKSLTTCLNQLNEKLKLMKSKTNNSLNLEENNNNSGDMDPFLTGSTNFDQETKEVLSAIDFINLDNQLEVEVEWEDEWIVEQVMNDNLSFLTTPSTSFNESIDVKSSLKRPRTISHPSTSASTNQILSIFEPHIVALKSLKSFCNELIQDDKNNLIDHTLIGRCFPMLSELEKELKKLESIELLNHSITD
ncbi:hypothetical protein CROQUDRAFT_107159 [Cronartium quercuum f. sp. fusiforme G11]|uniref:DDE-1 domain-containing protein n=1 Tax=Cronartium quercuum f. sp. fusiforme G11 TaxID=708437 RepID=A0A9P6NLN1_9BASI|nr:hypothetical protein CROQUDRAFT_107159 [Cronartium quercuum f. sp. fusiforme G11]